MIKYNYRLVLRKETGTAWETSTYIPLDGEPCYDTTNKIFKIGNGVNNFINLEPISGGINQNILDNYILNSSIGVSNGLATLDSNRKIPLDQINLINDNTSDIRYTYSSAKINALLVAGVSFMGHWDASTNTPTLTDGTGRNGDFYIASSNGTVNFGNGNIIFKAGDSVIYSRESNAWEKSINSDKVYSVNGIQGEVELALGDLTNVGSGPYLNGNFLKYNGVDWVAAPLPVHAINDMSDVDTVSNNPQVGNTLVYDGGNWVPGIISNSVLKELDEGSGTGWTVQRRLDNPDNYGDIGIGAFDLSESNVLSGTKGATGVRSFATGLNTQASGIGSFVSGFNTEANGEYSISSGQYSIASGLNSHAEGYTTIASGNTAHAEGTETQATGNNSHTEGLSTTAQGHNSHAEGVETIAQNDNMHVSGQFNLGTSTDTIQEVGIGTNINDKKNAFEIYTDGTITAPESTIALINSRGDKALATKEFVEATGSQTGLEYMEGSEGLEGWRLIGRNPSNYGLVGHNAVDFSNSLDNSSSNGATGNYSAAFGVSTISSGEASFAQGKGTITINEASVALGRYNVGTSTDTIHEIGIGYLSSGSPIRKNAFEIYTDGRVVTPELTNALINTPRSLITKEYLEANSGNATTLSGLTDITLTNIQDSDYIKWDSANSIWINSTAETLSVDELNDVDTTSVAPTVGQVLVWDGTNWIPGNTADETYIDENEIIATTNQTDFIVSSKIFSTTNCEVYTNGIRNKKSSYSVSDNGTDTTVVFTAGKSANDSIDIVIY